MWSNGHGCPPGEDNEEDSWEVRAFAADTGNASGTTWPPRFYPCAYCRREFRSAQALGGHMNVHRRDRARLQQRGPDPPRGPPPTGFPTEHGGNGTGVCFYYAQPGQNAARGHTVDAANFYFSAADEHGPNPVGTINFGAVGSMHEDYSTLEKVGSSRTDSDDGDDDEKGEEESVAEELDLELRLGW